MTNTRELSQLASLINVNDETKSIRIIANQPDAKIGIGTENPISKVDINGSVNVSGVVTATDINSSSDINLKQNIKQIDNSLDKVLHLNGVEFNWKDTNQPSVGVIAQEVEIVLPQLVKETDGIKAVNYNGLIGVLIEAVKDQQKQIEELKSLIKPQ